MSLANFIKNKFLGKTICICLGDDSEIITYDQVWISNKEYFVGRVDDVEEGVITLYVDRIGTIYLNAEEIQSFWEQGFDYHRSINTIITRRLSGARRKD